MPYINRNIDIEANDCRFQIKSGPLPHHPKTYFNRASISTPHKHDRWLMYPYSRSLHAVGLLYVHISLVVCIYTFLGFD